MPQAGKTGGGAGGKAEKTAEGLRLNDLGYFEQRGLDVLVFNNFYDDLFGDAKISGIELIHHGVRTATNGDVRLGPAPGQWDPIPRLLERRIKAGEGQIEARLAYPEHGFSYAIAVRIEGEGLIIGVDLEEALPRELEGRAGLHLEFLPSAYFGKAYLMDGRSGIFPRHPGGPMVPSPGGRPEPGPFAAGKSLVLAPEDPFRRVAITVREGGGLFLLDGRNTAQNGWYVVRTPIPAGRAGRVAEWSLAAHTIPGWIRRPVIGQSQLGYHPAGRKTAVIELDKDDQPLSEASLFRVAENGEFIPVYVGPVTRWGRFLRYQYHLFDFTSVGEEGLYVLAYGEVSTAPFRIAADVYAGAWHPTLDVFFPVQMDHMFVREAYRVWHGASHLDDARQAPVDHVHFDLYAQGSASGTPYEPGGHIPGLDTGGWFDAGDFDLRTQTQYAVVRDLVHAWEDFRPARDETTVDQKRRYVEIHAPDGVPDLLQQIEHGVLFLLAQFRAVGHAIPGIVEPDLVQYTHLGDAASKTDNLIYDPELKPGEADGLRSGTPDDRWAFTSESTPLNFGAIAALAAAGRALRGYRDGLAGESLAAAIRVWEEEHRREPVLFHHGNTTGGRLEEEELRAAVELLLATGDPRYARRIGELWPVVEEDFAANASEAVRALPYMDAAYAERLKARTMAYREYLERLRQENPYGVPIAAGGWAGSGLVIRFAATNYLLHKAFPDLIGADHVLRGVDYIFGCHPGSDVSLVSGVGAVSKEAAYGNNRADFSFIAGGVVPGVLLLKPDFPECKEDWPFLWGENEYVISVAAAYIYLLNAAADLAGGWGGRGLPA